MSSKSTNEKQMNIFLLVLAIFSTCYCQLIVNVRNNGGDVYRENIEANTTMDTISLEFRKSDGTLITQFVDGRNEVQVFRVVTLPEEERGQTHIQTMCFVLRFTKNEFISSDAMSKLRQKNPSTVRHPEESRPTDSFEMDLLLNVAASHIVSAHIANICADASAMTYARDSDLRLLSQILNRDYSILQTITTKATVANISLCADVTDDAVQPCLCHYDICVGWYPCGLKYCRGKDSAGRIVSYRCGIKTCGRCRRFEFRAPNKQLCIWDEMEFQLPQPESNQPAGGGDNLESNGWNDEAAVLQPVMFPANEKAYQKDEGNNLPPAKGFPFQQGDHVQSHGGDIHGVKLDSKVDGEKAGNLPVVNLRKQKVGSSVVNGVKVKVPDDDEDGD